MIKIIKKHSARNLLRLSCAALAVMLAAAVVPYLRGFAAEDAEETEVSGGDIVSGSDRGVAEQFAEPKQTLSSVVYSGACGDNATWTLDDEGTLTIDGSGPMTDYANFLSRSCPQHHHRQLCRNHRRLLVLELLRRFVACNSQQCQAHRHTVIRAMLCSALRDYRKRRELHRTV